MRNRHRNQLGKPDMTVQMQREIRSAMLGVAGALRCRPEPRDFWDDIGRSDGVLRYQFLDAAVAKCRQALEKARQEGVGTQAVTVRRVEVFFATICALALHGYEVTPPTDFGALLVGLTEEGADVVVAASRAQHDPSERNLEALRMEVIEADAVLDGMIATSSARLAERRLTRMVANR